MKKIDSSNITSSVLQPFTKTTWDYLQASYKELIEQICTGMAPSAPYNSTIVLNGCIDSGAGASYNISAGMVFYRKFSIPATTPECYIVPAFTNIPAPGQVPVLKVLNTYDAGDPIQFSDGNVYNVHLNTTAYWVMGVSGSGICDFGDLIYATEEPWHLVGGTGEPAFQNSWANIGGYTPARFKKDSTGWVCI